MCSCGTHDDKDRSEERGLTSLKDLLLLADALAELVEAVDADGAHSKEPGAGAETGGGQVALWKSGSQHEKSLVICILLIFLARGLRVGLSGLVRFSSMASLAVRYVGDVVRACCGPVIVVLIARAAGLCPGVPVVIFGRSLSSAQDLYIAVSLGRREPGH